jgi:hypothetical protein
MRVKSILRFVGGSLRASPWQWLALLFCLLYGLAIIVNVELAGNPMWFWYATLYHHGVKLYADLHCALQPLFILEMNAWMQVFGVKVLAMEGLSVVHVLLLAVGMQLLLRESAWPDWQKAVVLAGSFVLCTHFNAYLFDDFHVVSDIFYVYALVLLLWLPRAVGAWLFWVAAALGVLSGLATTNRVTDGAVLVASAGICLLFLVPRRRLAALGIFAAAALLTVVGILGMTGDTFRDYATNSIFLAAGSKGGSASLMADPWLMFDNAVHLLLASRKWVLLWVVGLVAVAALAQLYARSAQSYGHRSQSRWKSGVGLLLLLQLAVAVVCVAVRRPLPAGQLFSGLLLDQLSIVAVVALYMLVPVVAARWLWWRSHPQGSVWDAREVLVLPLFSWLAAGSASSGGSPRNFFEMMALLLLLVAVVVPLRTDGNWVNASLLTVLILLAVPAVVTKAREPYEWQNYRSSAMFANRQWYRHPVYGPMYMERDQLNFIVPVCAEISQGNGSAELLSLPFPYPNYFCATPPWHGYVQTFFDTSTRASVEDLIQELKSDPPQWIVYQRQLKFLALHESLYNHGQRLAQRDLDELIVQKLADGQWQLIENRPYLEGDGWLVIRTRR